MNDVYILAIMSTLLLGGVVFAHWSMRSINAVAHEVIVGARPGAADGFRLGKDRRRTLIYSEWLTLELLHIAFFVAMGFVFRTFTIYVHGDEVRAIGSLFAYFSFLAGAAMFFSIPYYLRYVTRRINADERGILVGD